jgi:hypothetical protein
MNKGSKRTNQRLPAAKFNVMAPPKREYRQHSNQHCGTSSNAVG